MAHEAQKNYVKKLKERFPHFFQGQRVLDVGALDINGNNQIYFEDCEYIGIDIIPGKNVSIISAAHEYTPFELFDVVISTETFEHDMHFEKTLPHIIRLLIPGGILIFTCATTGRKEHGTLSHSPNSSGTVKIGGEWAAFYQNRTEKEIRMLIDCDKVFRQYEFDKSGTDLRFWGIKK